MNKQGTRAFALGWVLVFSVTAGVFLAHSGAAALRSEEPVPRSEAVLPPPKAEQTPPPADRSFNLLLCGTDGSNKRTDTMILARFDSPKKKISLISLPRDTQVTVNGKIKKLNACVPAGGKELLLRVVEEMTAAPVDFYAFVDFEGFRAIIDLLGGVEIEVPRDMYYSDPTQNLKIDLKKGLQVLDGAKAEQYVRFRRYLEGDIARTRVQQKFLAALIAQKNKPAYWFKLPEIFALLQSYSETNITLGDLTSRLSVTALLKEDNVELFQLPGYADDSQISYFIYDAEKTKALFREQFGGAG